MRQQQVKVGERQASEPEAESTVRPESTDTKDRAEHLKELDDLLDEIDSVLEENAEEFVRGYIQKGGE